jgi:hypothetical protein
MPGLPFVVVMPRNSVVDGRRGVIRSLLISEDPENVVRCSRNPEGIHHFRVFLFQQLTQLNSESPRKGFHNAS